MLDDDDDDDDDGDNGGDSDDGPPGGRHVRVADDLASAVQPSPPATRNRRCSTRPAEIERTSPRDHGRHRGARRRRRPGPRPATAVRAPAARDRATLETLVPHQQRQQQPRRVEISNSASSVAPSRKQ